MARVRRDRHAQDRVRVTGEVFRRGMEDDVRPKAQRPLERRRRERVVDHDQRPPAALGNAPGDGRHGRRDVDHLEMRVRGRLEPDQPRPFGERLPERVLPARQVDVAGVDPGAAPDPLEIAVRAAVDVVTDHDLVARRRQLRDGRGRRRPRRERDPVLPALESGDRPFEPLAGRVLRAGVLVAAARRLRRRPGRRSRSGRSAARRRRSARRVRRRRGRPACRTRTPDDHHRSARASGPW